MAIGGSDIYSGGGYAVNPFAWFLPKGGAAPAPGATTAAGTLQGAPATGYTAASGGIPQVPSPQTTQTQAISGNIAALPQLQGLASGVNAFNLGQLTGQYQAGIPQYNAMIGESSGNILSALKGEVPSDVVNLIQQSAAERGIATGVPGSPNTNAAYLRALGLTSLGQQQYGETALTAAMARAPKVGLYNVAGDMVSPEQQQQAAYMANVLASSPVPQAAYNQALWAAMMGMNRGYGGARTFMPTPSGTSNPAVDIAGKYNPFTPTTSGPKYGEPPAPKQGYNLPADEMTDEDWYLGNLGSPPYTGNQPSGIFDYGVNYGPYGQGFPTGGPVPYGANPVYGGMHYLGEMNDINMATYGTPFTPEDYANFNRWGAGASDEDWFQQIVGYPSE